MPFRSEADAAITAEAARKTTDTVGWSSKSDNLGVSPHVLVTVTSMDGFHLVLIVLDSEGLSDDEILQACLIDTFEEIRRRRRDLEP